MVPLFKLPISSRAHYATRSIHFSHQTSPEAYFKFIEKCANDRALLSGRAVHSQMIINGLARLTHFAAKLISMYAECGELSVAHKLFDKIPKSNYRRWIVILGAYAKCGFYRETLILFREMQGEGVRPNNYVLPSVLKACGHLSDRWMGKEVHCLILRCSFEFDAFVNSALIDMYSKCGLFEKARWVFDGVLEKDVVGLNAMVSGFVQGGLIKEALSLVEEMQLAGVKPNVGTWNTLIAGSSQAGDDLMVDELFQLMRVNGVEPDVVSWTSVISGFVQNFRSSEAFATFKKMLDSGYCPTSNTISSLLPTCANVASVRHGREIHGYAVVIGVGEDVYVRSALVDMYSKCGFISAASTLFEKMSKRNSVTWNSMIFGYANHGYCSEAIELFKRMEREEEDKLDHLTYTAALTACSHGGMIELGNNLFNTMQTKYKIKPRLEHYACVVDLLGRAGKLTEAYDMIKTMPMEPDFFVWGALLGACRQHGNIDLAQVAVKHLSKLEPQSSGSSVVLCNLYAGAGSWGNAARLKKIMKKRKLKKFPGCSWIESG